jgi:hypothetical protein
VGQNLRAAGEGELRVGHHRAFRAETADDDKVEICSVPEAVEARGRCLLRRCGATSPDAELRRIAPITPVFRITT